MYTVESIAFDALAGKGSARVSTLTVPSAESQTLGLSSLVFVDHVEQIDSAPTDHTEHAAPFFVGQTLVYPNVGNPVMKTTTKELPFFFTIYRGETGPLTGTAQLLRNGGVVAEAPLEIAVVHGLAHPAARSSAGLGAGAGHLRAAHHRRQRPPAGRRVGVFHAAGLSRALTLSS